MPSGTSRWNRGLLAALGTVVVCSLVAAACGGGAHKVTTSSAPSPREVFTSEDLGSVPAWVEAEKLPAAAVPGAKLFAIAGCLACHTYLGSGSSNLHAPDLTAIGAQHLGVSFQVRHLACPACVIPGSQMPKFAPLGGGRLHEIAVFLEASKGTRS